MEHPNRKLAPQEPSLWAKGVMKKVIVFCAHPGNIATPPEEWREIQLRIAIQGKWSEVSNHVLVCVAPTDTTRHYMF